MTNLLNVQCGIKNNTLATVTLKIQTDGGKGEIGKTMVVFGGSDVTIPILMVYLKIKI